MNPWILDFAKKHRAKFSGDVLDVGSYNVNGSLRDVLPITWGVDMRAGPGVDQVCPVENLAAEFGAESFDHVCSADALEHMQDWDAALSNLWAVLKPDGYLFLTMANPKKGYHGHPHDYWRMEIDDFRRVFHNNPVLDWFVGGPSQGVIARKTAALDLSIRPRAVNDPKLRRTQDRNPQLG